MRILLTIPIVIDDDNVDDSDNNNSGNTKDIKEEGEEFSR